MLVTCYECEAKISMTAEVCPHCGFRGFDKGDTHHGASYYSPEITKLREQNTEDFEGGGCAGILVIGGFIFGLIKILESDAVKSHAGIVIFGTVLMITGVVALFISTYKKKDSREEEQ